jgi:nicotinamidase-related amidase
MRAVPGAPARELAAFPSTVSVDTATAALLVIDMQRDFCDPQGWDAASGLDVSAPAAVVDPVAEVIGLARAAGIEVLHTREGHAEDLSDCPPVKLEHAGACGAPIGSYGPLGPFLVRGSEGHAIDPRCAPHGGEPVIDKTGKDAFVGTELRQALEERRIETLFFCGVTTECCVQSTFRTAADLGYRCVVLADACASPIAAWHEGALQVMSGIFGWQIDRAAFSAFLAGA